MAKNLTTRHAAPVRRSGETSTLARAVEELRELELRVHESNVDEEAAGRTSELPPALMSALAEFDFRDDDAPVLMEVVALGPDVAPFAAQPAAADPPVAPERVPEPLKSTHPFVAPAKLPVPDPAADELSLDVADHVDSDQLCAFLGTLPDSIAAMSSATHAYCAAPHEREHGERARAAFEHIETAASSVGVRGLATFAQHAKSLLEGLTTTDAAIPKWMLDALLRADTCMQGMADVVWGHGSLPEDAREVLDDLIEAELRAILDLTLRVEEPEYSFDVRSAATGSTTPSAVKHSSGFAAVETAPLAIP